MKKITISILTLFISLVAFNQAPNSFSYQSVIKDANGDLVKSTSIGVQISILADSETGVAVYTETHTVSTNANGLLSVVIGGGTSSDDFSAINWAGHPYFIKSEFDLNGGTNYTISGTSKLQSVPYALHANTVEAENLPTSYTKFNVEDSLKIGANGLSIKEITELTGTTASGENYIYVDLPEGYTFGNCCVLSLQIFNGAIMNSHYYHGLGYTGSDETVGYALNKFTDFMGSGAVTESIQIKYPTEDRSKAFSLILMKIR